MSFQNLQDPLDVSIDFHNQISVTGKVWRMRAIDDQAIFHMQQSHQLSELVARLLHIRHVEPEKVISFLNPKILTCLPDPDHLKDMPEAVRRVAQAIMTGEPITLFGDYDVDGATSTALIMRFLKMVGGHVNFVIPNRFEDGYGPSIPLFKDIFAQGKRLIITLDCGTTAFTALEYAAQVGMDVVVIDHHGTDHALPPAIAIVNPNRPDETSPLKHLAAVGLSFLFAVGLNRYFT